MAEVYADLIVKGLKTLDDVPARIRQKVYDILVERGWEPDGPSGAKDVS